MARQTRKRPRKKKQAQQRTIRLVRSPEVDGLAIVCISAGEDEHTHYTVREIPCEIGGRGFAVHKLGLGTLYHVRVGDPEDCSCECLGFLRHGKCKHVLGLLALIDGGKLEPVQQRLDLERLQLRPE